jgi:hypothetical protein
MVRPVETAETKASAFERFSELMWGLAGTQCLHVVARLGVADALAAGPRPIADVARDVGADPDALERILRWLTAMGVFTQPAPGVAGLTEVGELLVDGHPATTRYNALFFGDLTYRTWAGAVETARTGRPAFAEHFGTPFFDYLAEHPEDAETFNRAMQGGSAARLPALVAWDWAGVGAVVDVGGGNGAVLRALLAEHPHLRGTVFDLPNVVESAAREIAAAGLADRCEVVGGSFFDRVPDGGDVYILAQILHDWHDDDACRILTRVRESMREDAVLLVLELIVPEDDMPHPAKLVDLQMLFLLGGRERTRTQWAELLRRGGFELAGVTDGRRASLIEARPRSG